MNIKISEENGNGEEPTEKRKVDNDDSNNDESPPKARKRKRKASSKDDHSSGINDFIQYQMKADREYLQFLQHQAEQEAVMRREEMKNHLQIMSLMANALSTSSSNSAQYPAAPYNGSASAPVYFEL
jgi:hypothetical protein